MTFSEFERVLNHCPHLTNFWLFLRVGEFLLFVLLTSIKKSLLLNFSNLQERLFSVALACLNS